MEKITKKIQDIILFGSDDEEKLNFLMMMGMETYTTRKHLKV